MSSGLCHLVSLVGSPEQRPGQNHRCSSICQRRLLLHLPLDLLCFACLFHLLPPSPAIYICIKGFVPNNPAFQQQIIFTSDEKFWLKYLLGLLLGMSCVASAKSNMIIFQRKQDARERLWAATKRHLSRSDGYMLGGDLGSSSSDSL